MAAIATSAALQHPIARHSLHSSAYMPHPAPPFEGIVDFTHRGTSHTHFGPYTASTPDIAFQQQPSMTHRTDGAEWKQPSFFSYRPNEVKHRKRTTRQQLKVLEETFRTTQKPDGNVRKALAAQLDMTPRNVQVWFQNRRAKDKTLAKRAQKIAEDSLAKDGSPDFEASSPTDLANEPYAPQAENPTYSSEQTFQVQFAPTSHSGSTSPTDATFHQKFEVLTPVHNSQNLTSPPPRAISSTSTSFSSLDADQAAQSAFDSAANYAVEAAAPSYRALFAPRASLPHIHATPFQQDIQHQRSNSSPAFLCNVDSSSNLSLTTYASINGVLYPQRFASTLSQQASQSVYNSSYPRVPSGPLPTSDFSFGHSAPNTVRSSGAEAERDSDAASFAHYQFGSMSGSNTPSSLSGLSQYGSVASLVDSDVAAQTFDDDSSAPFPWHNEQRRGSASHSVRSYPVNRMGGGFSPLSVGYSSPPRAGATPPTEPESDGSDQAVYIPNRSEWMAYEDVKPSVQPIAAAPRVPADVKAIGGFQQNDGLSGFVEQDNSAESTFQYMALLDSQSYGQQPLTLANQISGLNASFGSNNLGGFRPMQNYPYA